MLLQVKKKRHSTLQYPFQGMAGGDKSSGDVPVSRTLVSLVSVTGESWRMESIGKSVIAHMMVAILPPLQGLITTVKSF